MEKLQPLIKHKFWVIAGLALLLPVVGWWINTSSVADHIQQRWEKLESTKVTPAAGQPNEDYITRIGEVNTILSKRQTKLNLELYNKQKNLRTWPQYVANAMEDKHFGDRVDTSTLRIYARNLQDEIVGMLDNLPWYEWDPRTGQESGMVYVESLDVIPPEKKKWPDGNPPTSQVLWETQEDVWLTRSILDAIKKVNNEAGASKITDAPIRSLFLLQFRGGSRPQATEGSAEGGMDDAGGMEGEGALSPGAGGVVTPGFGRGMGAGDEGGTGNSPNSMLSFESQIQMNLDAVFGPDTIQNVQGAGDEGGAAPVMPGGPGLNGGEGSGGKTRRYVDDDPTLPYKTRGFYLEVYMLHDKLPDLQAALVSMPWPTELLMIHQVSDKLDDIIALQDNANQKVLPPMGRGGGGDGGRQFSGFQNRRGMFGGGRGGAAGRFAAPGGGRSTFGGRFPTGRGNTGFPRGGIGPMDPMGLDGNPQASQSQDLLLYKAMDDFYVTRIGIAGLMTIYRSPEEMAALKADGGDGTAGPMDGAMDENPPNGEDATDTPQPADPEAADAPESTEPAEDSEQAPPMQPQTDDGGETQTEPAPGKNAEPMNGNETPPPAEASSPPEGTPAAPAESPPSTGG